MKGQQTNLPEDPNALGNTDPEELSTNQEATPIPWFCGEARFALRWISPIYNQTTKEAPNTRPGKK